MKIIHSGQSARTYDIKSYMLEGFRSGSQQSFSVIFKQLYPVLYYYGLQITQNQAASQDIAGEAFIKVWERRQMFRQFSVLKSYLYTIVKNDSINWLKNENRRRQSENIGAAMQNDEPPVWESLVKTEIVAELQAAIGRLPPQRQKVIRMLYHDGKSVKQVAGELQVSLTAIKLHKKAGLQFLKKNVAARY